MRLARQCDEFAYAAEFARGLLDPALPPPSGLSATAGYDVYRNNVTVSLINALAEIYPAVKRITGATFFRAMARAHVRATPPTSPLLFDYGRAFPDFVEAYEYAQETPWLADVARIERAWLDAYHAPEAPLLSAPTLSAVPAEALPTARLIPHPATKIVRSALPAVSIFAANRQAGEVEAIAAGPEDALITRPGIDVLVRRLPPGGARFISHLVAGEPLVEAADAALAECDAFDLSVSLAGVLEAGAFSALQQIEETAWR